MGSLIWRLDQTLSIEFDGFGGILAVANITALDIDFPM